MTPFGAVQSSTNKRDRRGAAQSSWSATPGQTRSAARPTSSRCSSRSNGLKYQDPCKLADGFRVNIDSVGAIRNLEQQISSHLGSQLESLAKHRRHSACTGSTSTGGTSTDQSLIRPLHASSNDFARSRRGRNPCKLAKIMTFNSGDSAHPGYPHRSGD